jgi:dihydrofolate reductase
VSARPGKSTQIQRRKIDGSIGGAEIYRLALPIAGTLHVSWVRASRTGDTVFPWFDGRSWRVVNAKDYGAFRHVEYRHRG